MSINILVDMNLSPDWVSLLNNHGWPSVHWSAVGDPRADDSVIMDWALTKGYIVFTHDLDFGTILALTHATGPSVIQVRGQNILPDYLGGLLLAALRQHKTDLTTGALVVVDENTCRVRILPIL